MKAWFIYDSKMLKLTLILCNHYKCMCWLFPNTLEYCIKIFMHHDQRCQNNKNFYTAFLKRQNFIFSVIAGNIWFVFCFSLINCTSFQICYYLWGRGLGDVNLDIPIKHINNAFFNELFIYCCCCCCCFFPTFWCCKDSQRQLICNSAVEKELSIIEKDKEDQNIILAIQSELF